MHAMTIFNMTPILAICDICILPDEKTIAFGGVATGSMKAIEAEIVAGIINRSGLRFNATAVPFMIGNSAAAVAVFDVSSVKNVSIMQMMKTIING